MKTSILKHSVTVEKRDDETVIFRSGLDLGQVANNTIEWLDYWAENTPEQTFLAERDGDGWREVSFKNMRTMVRKAGANLLDNGVKPGDSVAVLSGPSVNHGILVLATQMIGAVLVPLAEQYSLVTEAHNKLEYCIRKTKPVLAYVSDAKLYGPAIMLDSLKNIDIIAANIDGAPRQTTLFDELLVEPTEEKNKARDDAYAKITPDTLAKILFTSGSTSHPKGVPQTQHMMCVNQAQYLACLPLLREKAHSILSWLPWNHVFAGSSDFNMMLSNGGSLYLDDGKPVGKLFDRTLENIRTRAGTLSFNVPLAHGLAIKAMKNDPELKQKYFGDLEVFFYAGASLPAEIWDAVEDMAMEIKKEIPLMTSSWGLTETAPCCLVYYEPGASSGMIGVPVPELEAKLIPLGSNRFEIRVRGPNVFKEYFGDPDKTKSSFDEEGYFITGDAVRWVDPQNPALGVYFDGRLTEDFKLMTGTWVQATTLRISALGVLQDLVQDLIIVGEGHEDVGIFVFPAPNAIPPGTEIVDGCYICPQFNTDLKAVLQKLAKNATGSSNRISRAVVLAEPPSVADGEITAKGSFNTSTIIKRRTRQLQQLYNDESVAVIRAT